MRFGALDSPVLRASHLDATCNALLNLVLQ